MSQAEDQVDRELARGLALLWDRDLCVPLGFARAELATLGAVFDHVALAAEPDTLAGSGGGNLVAVASDAPIDVTAFVEEMGAADLDWSAIEGAVLERWIGDADVLVDDHAPVDQLLTPYG